MSLEKHKQHEDSELTPEQQKKQSKLSERQYEFADEQFEKAVNEGVLRREDRARLYGKLTQLKPAQVEKAEQLIEEYVGYKRYKRELFKHGYNGVDAKLKKFAKDKEKAADEKIKGVKQMEHEGLISSTEATNYLNKYDSLSGKQRNKEQDKMMKRLELFEMRGKEYSTLLTESPHFAKEGKLTTEGQKLLDSYNDGSHGERERMVLKRRLIRQIHKLDHFSNLCKDRYEKGNQHYQNGEYDLAVAEMNKNVKTCDRYPESARLKEFADFARWDANNGAYEMLKDKNIQSKRAEVSECSRGEDHENAVRCAQEAVDMAKNFIAKTYDGRNGEYLEGSSPEKARSDKWVTPYMRRLLQKTEEEAEMAQNAYNEFFAEEARQDELILTGQAEELDQLESEDKTNQARMKAALDTQESLREQDTQLPEEQHTEETILQETFTPPQTADIPQTTERVDLQEEQYVQQPFDELEDDINDATETSFESEEQNTTQEASVEQASTMSSEQKEQQEVVIDEYHQGELREQDAEEILRAQAKLKLKVNDRELNTEQDIKRKMSEDLVESRRERIEDMRASGKMSAEQAEFHLNQAAQMEQANRLGEEVTDSHRKQGRIINFADQANTQKNIISTFQKARDEREAIKKHQQQSAATKAEQLRNAA